MTQNQHDRYLPESVFQALSDTTRLHIVLLLQQQHELCVCELTHTLSLEQPKVSRHLANLRKIGLVTDRREGTWVFYQLHPNLPDWIHTVVHAASTQGVDQTHLNQLTQRLTKMPGRPPRHTVQESNSSARLTSRHASLESYPYPG